MPVLLCNPEQTKMRVFRYCLLVLDERHNWQKGEKRMPTVLLVADDEPVGSTSQLMPEGDGCEVVVEGLEDALSRKRKNNLTVGGPTCA
jgi:hypothetical protein